MPEILFLFRTASAAMRITATFLASAGCFLTVILEVSRIVGTLCLVLITVVIHNLFPFQLLGFGLSNKAFRKPFRKNAQKFFLLFASFAFLMG